ncbi:Hypothetical protein FKW44_023862, partial [Caligus rogercresseyi]
MSKTSYLLQKRLNPASHEDVLDILDCDLRRGADCKEHPCNLVPMVMLFAHLR